jgi:DNA polymerase III epsilon subunit-like protein
LYLFIDTETTGRPFIDPCVKLVQLAYSLYDENYNRIDNFCSLIKPSGFQIPEESIKKHGITTERALTEGKDLKEVLERFLPSLKKATHIVAHNIKFDINIMKTELKEMNMYDKSNFNHDWCCTCTDRQITTYCGIPSPYKQGYKWPKLEELHMKLFGILNENAHTADGDLATLERCFFELKKMDLITWRKRFTM